MTRTNNCNKDMKTVAGIIFLAVLTGCNQAEPVLKKESSEPKTDSVKVFVLAKDSVKKVISLPGELLPDENAQIRAKAQGYIKKLNVDIGS